MPSTTLLTRRQIQVQAMLRAGWKVRAIADKLGVSTQRVYRIKAAIKRAEASRVSQP